MKRKFLGSKVPSMESYIIPLCWYLGRVKIFVAKNCWGPVFGTTAIKP